MLISISIPAVNLVVAPCFEDNNDPTELDWNTQVRLSAAAAIFFQERNLDVRIVVGGDRLRKMRRSFADLMEDFLINKMNVPQNSIVKEVHTFDTSSQLWAIEHVCKLNKGLILTDSAQAKHIKELLRGYGMKSWGVVTMEEVLLDGRHDGLYAELLRRNQRTLAWKIFQVREFVMWFITRFFDPRGERMGKIAAYTRKQKK